MARPTGPLRCRGTVEDLVTELCDEFLPGYHMYPRPALPLLLPGKWDENDWADLLARGPLPAG